MAVGYCLVSFATFTLSSSSGHVITEDFLAVGVIDLGKRVSSSATISLNTHSRSRLGGNGELDLVEISPFLSRWSCKSLHFGKFLIGNDRSDVVDGDVVERNKKGKLDG
jgi:hypothetical protein